LKTLRGVVQIEAKQSKQSSVLPWR